MSFDSKTLFSLLPAIHRIRDAGGLRSLTANPTPGALEEFVAILAGQVGVLEEELEQLYENQFAETAAAWALPYLGDLVGIRDLGGPLNSGPLTARAEVANTIAYRRRKGTAAMLEQLARDTSGRPAVAVEFWQRLATTQHMNHRRAAPSAWASLRRALDLECTGTPFERASRTMEARRIEPALGRWNIRNIGLFLWRLRDYRHSETPLLRAHLPGDRHFRFHPLGIDAPLCAMPEPETEISHLAGRENVPSVLTRRLLAGAPLATDDRQSHPSTKWYGRKLGDGAWSEASVLVRIKQGGMWDGLPADKVLVADLHDVHEDGDPSKPIIRWAHDDRNMGEQEALLDPVRGRIFFKNPQPDGARASYSSLFSADLGGGEYARTSSFDRGVDTPKLAVSQQLPPEPERFPTISAALAANTGESIVVEIVDSARYAEPAIEIDATGRAVEVRAADECWPTLELSDELAISGNADGSITINGILICGTKGITTQGNLGTLRMRHSTSVPGLQVGPDGRIDISVDRLAALNARRGVKRVEIENCILGPIFAGNDTEVRLRNCIVDAGSLTAHVLSRTKAGEPGGMWRIENCTVIGKVSVRGLELASNSIFLGKSVKVERRQEGCVRFCWLPEDSIVPRRHKCVPRTEKDEQGIEFAVDDVPRFSSLLFGDSRYCLLSPFCPDSIRRGADDESEMGVHHDLFTNARMDHLRARLHEYLRFGLEAGIFHESGL